MRLEVISFQYCWKLYIVHDMRYFSCMRLSVIALIVYTLLFILIVGLLEKLWPYNYRKVIFLAKDEHAEIVKPMVV